MEPFFEAYRAVMPFLVTTGNEPTRERLQSQADRERFDDTTKCILCAACTTSCPVFWNDGQYFGPQAIVSAHRFIFDSRDEGADQRLEILNDKEGVWRCRTTFNCTEACPRGIEVTKAIQEVKRALADRTSSSPRCDALLRAAARQSRAGSRRRRRSSRGPRPRCGDAAAPRRRRRRGHADASPVPRATVDPRLSVGGERLASMGIVADLPAGVPAPPRLKDVSWVLADLTPGRSSPPRPPTRACCPASTLKTLTALTLIPACRRRPGLHRDRRGRERRRHPGRPPARPHLHRPAAVPGPAHGLGQRRRLRAGRVPAAAWSRPWPR